MAAMYVTYSASHNYTRTNLLILMQGNQYNMDFSGLESSDVLENFDFDSFLQSTDDPSFTFDPTLPFGTADGVEAGAGDA